ncbi:MAG: enoyl-CoA hydratase/isomerase family protein [Caldimonas sp.]
MTGPVLLSEPDGDGVRTLRLGRPEKANALSAGLVDAVLAALDMLGPETRLLVVRGEGRNFCAGFDFAGHEEQSEADLLLRFVRINEVLARLRGASFLTLAWVSGAAFGAGADIACSCAVRLGDRTARFRFPGFQFGVALGTRRLATVVGAERARQVLLHNEELDADTARSCGLLNDVVDAERLDKSVDAVARISGRLGVDALKTLRALTDDDSADRDLAELVRSVGRPGLHGRIAAYRKA